MCAKHAHRRMDCGSHAGPSHRWVVPELDGLGDATESLGETPFCYLFVVVLFCLFCSALLCSVLALALVLVLVLVLGLGLGLFWFCFCFVLVSTQKYQNERHSIFRSTSSPTTDAPEK